MNPAEAKDTGIANQGNGNVEANQTKEKDTMNKHVGSGQGFRQGPQARTQKQAQADKAGVQIIGEDQAGVELGDDRPGQERPAPKVVVQQPRRKVRKEKVASSYAEYQRVIQLQAGAVGQLQAGAVGQQKVSGFIRQQ